MKLPNNFLAFAAIHAVLAVPSPTNTKVDARNSSNHPVNQTECGGKQFVYEQLAGYGLVPSNARDKYGDTLGGYGSSIALERNSWRKTKNGSYTGLLWALPDRGWNTEGTLNYQNRIHKFSINFTPKPNATLENPSGPNLQFNYLDSILLTGPDGTPTTGLDADLTGFISYPGFAMLPVATYEGDGFGGTGSGGKRISIDSEGLVLDSDGGFWVSDEYGPYIYKFSATGRMERAIMPPPAYIPRRNGSLSFSAASLPIYDQDGVVIPEDPTTGRANNQGLEGLTATADGKTLYALLQSALNQEGGPNNPSRKQARLLEYDISSSDPKYRGEYVVTLPLWTDPTEDPSEALKVAAQSAIHSLGSGQFLILARDSDAGHGASSSLSIYRHADIFDIFGSSGATDIKSESNDNANGSIASSSGELEEGVQAAEYCSFLDYNVNSQLGRFGVRNGGAQDEFLLNEKWESLALMPVDGKDGKDGEWYLLSLSDNDYITQDGYMNFGNFPYSDSSGFNLDNQALIFQIKLPKQTNPS